MKSLFKGLIAAAVAVGVFASPAEAAWPEKPISLVIPFSAGGGTDKTLLPLKPLLEEKLGQSVLFVYKPGAGGRIAWEYMKARGDDGYTIGALVAPHLPNTITFDDPDYTLADFASIGIITSDVPVWFVRKDSEIEDMNDLIARAKAAPGEVTVAIGSFTGEHYVTLAALEKAAGIKFRTVNVKGGSKVVSNILGGHLQVGISRPSSISGSLSELKGLGVVSADRKPIMPDTPTFDEQGLAEYNIPKLSNARGFLASASFKKNNPEAFATLVAAVEAAVKSDEYVKVLDGLGLPLTWQGPAEADQALLDFKQSMLAFKPVIEAAKASN